MKMENVNFLQFGLFPKINRVPNPKGDPTLINNFIKILQIFWNNGGSIIFFLLMEIHISFK